MGQTSQELKPWRTFEVYWKYRLGKGMDVSYKQTASEAVQDVRNSWIAQCYPEFEITKIICNDWGKRDGN
ncbi:MAG TPA: hypothetical protein VJ841_03510 [Candidatus Saccharimonadales bacterium]|nr:hypothetical protein [Candidatus Saccharimonadales bacterium]